MKLYINAALVLLATGTMSNAIAEANESCGDILRYASRDVRRDVSFSDLRLYYYQRVCSSDNAGLDISYGDASQALGFNFTSKSEYCKAEESATKNTKFSKTDSSIVVRNSLDAYVACRAISDKGINMSVVLPPVESPTVFSIIVQRLSSLPQSVNSLILDPEAVICSAEKDGQQQTLNQPFNSINFNLPQSDAKWSLLCTRKAVVDSSNNKTYPPTQLILTTSAGALPVYLPQSSYASGTWTSELRGDVAVQANKLAVLERLFASQKVIAQCSGDGWLPRPPAPECPANYKDSGQFSHSAPGGKAGYGGHCRICIGS